MSELIKFVQDQMIKTNEVPNFKAGDNVTVAYKIVEGAKTRTQLFRGDVIQINGTAGTKTFTVRKISEELALSVFFPYNSPNIESVTLNKIGKVRRSKLYYLRDRSGKSARIKEKRGHHIG